MVYIRKRQSLRIKACQCCDSLKRNLQVTLAADDPSQSSIFR